MKVIIEGTATEIAALVVAVQERRGERILIDGKEINHVLSGTQTET